MRAPQAGRCGSRALAIVGFVLLAGCAAPSAPSPTVTITPTSPPAAAADPLAGITVPDAYTSVTVTPLSAAVMPFPGSDGRYHLAYDLQLTNASAVPATITRVDVVDVANASRVVASYSGPDLLQRMRALPSAPTTDAGIPAQASKIVFVDFALDDQAAVPRAVLHHLWADAAPSPAVRVPEPVDYLVAPLSTSAGPPRVIGPPVKGERWVALNGCCLPGFPHRSSLAPLNGTLVNGQRFAIDWKQLDAQGHFYEGDKTQNQSYVDYGSEIIAVADGTVTSTLDTLDANSPGVLPANDPVLGPQITVETVDGNHIIQDLGGGVYAFYAHLEKGSLLVEPGDKVTKGQVIAKLGNTGNANASHMHFQLMDGPSALGADGLPYVLERFSLRGYLDPELIADSDDYLSGQFPLGGPPEPHTDQLPLAWAIVDFPA
ncbi:MAG: M23 family metallopeptidase [Pseudonocardia sp.]